MKTSFEKRPQSLPYRQPASSPASSSVCACSTMTSQSSANMMPQALSDPKSSHARLASRTSSCQVQCILIAIMSTWCSNVDDTKTTAETGENSYHVGVICSTCVGNRLVIMYVRTYIFVCTCRIFFQVTFETISI